MGNTFPRLIGLGLLACALLLPAGLTRSAEANGSEDDHARPADSDTDVASPAEPERLTLQQRREMAGLGAIARSDDWAEASEAIGKLEAFGEPGRRLRSQAVRQWLLRDRGIVQVGLRAVRDRSRLDAMQQQMEQRRREARAHLQQLDRSGIDKAREHRQTLLEMHKVLTQAHGRMAPTIEAMARRAQLLEWWNETEGPDHRLFTDESEDALWQQLEQQWQLDRVQVARIMDFNRGRAPDDDNLAALWFHIACRRINTWNETIKPLMDDEEWTNAKLVNAYREALGILPYELDARLIQAARRHSREMTELGYFSHTSPTEGLRSHADRMRKAGYPHPLSENIAYGRRSGEATFRQWFNSPGHHRNMVRENTTGLGVGRSRQHWTQKMGTDRRMMTLSAEQRKSIEVKGEILPPSRR